METMIDAPDRNRQIQTQTNTEKDTDAETDRHRHNGSAREERDNSSDVFPGLSAGAERAAVPRCCGAAERSAK